MKKNKTLRFKLLLFFLTSSFLTILIVLSYNFLYFNKKEQIGNIVNGINAIYVTLLQDIQAQSNFLNYETTNVKYFTTGKSEYLDKHKKYSSILDKQFNELYKNKMMDQFDIMDHLETAHENVLSSRKIFDTIVRKTFTRGYKDYGVEGKMRDKVHLLEEFNIDQTKVLSLRRHEKDYIIRKEVVYIEKLGSLAQDFRKEIRESKVYSKPMTDSIISILNTYSNLFNTMVRLDMEIGNSYNQFGLKQELEENHHTISNEFDALISKAEISKSKLFNNLELLYFTFFIALVLLSISVSIVISGKIANPLRKFTKYLSRITKSNFRVYEPLEIESNHREVQILNHEFNAMINQLHFREKQRDQAEKALMENELKYRELSDMLPQSIFETNELYNLTYVNKNWIEAFGYSKIDLKNGINILEIIMAQNHDILVEGDFESNEYLARRKDGSTFSALVYSSRIVQDDEFKGLRGIIIDNTERKQYIEELKKQKQKAEESDKLKSAFLANMSHEIRTPMNAILGFSELLSNMNMDGIQKNEFLGHIKTSGELLLNLIDDIIDIAKIEAGELKIDQTICYINSILSEIETTYNNLKRKKQKEHIEIRLVKAFDDDKFNIKSDPFRLKQIITNLVGNALKFTEKGYIEFGYKFCEHDDNMLCFYVKDTGIGIDEKQIPYIFDRFRQAELYTTNNHGGTGLGLAISRHLVTLLGGRIWVHSVLGEGTVFYFEIPSTNANVENTEQYFMPEDYDDHEYFWGNKTILIAEDEYTNFIYIKEALKKTGARILHAEDGIQAVELVKENEDIDIILMDIQMPRKNGYQATVEIKKIRNIPVIAQTAYAMAGEKERSLRAGCDDYVSKPVKLAVMLNKINKYLEKSTVTSYRSR